MGTSQLIGLLELEYGIWERALLYGLFTDQLTHICTRLPSQKSPESTVQRELTALLHSNQFRQETTKVSKYPGPNASKTALKRCKTSHVCF